MQVNGSDGLEGIEARCVKLGSVFVPGIARAIVAVQRIAQFVSDNTCRIDWEISRDLAIEQILRDSYFMNALSILLGLFAQLSLFTWAIFLIWRFAEVKICPLGASLSRECCPS
jgi:hypothetical protein